MAKPEWGTKRECQGCGAHFYDLKRDPIVCPKCDERFVIEVVKTKPAEKKVEPKKEAPPVAAVVEKESDDDVEDELAAEDDDNADGESFVADASELEGGDDVGIVIETDTKNGEGER